MLEKNQQNKTLASQGVVSQTRALRSGNVTSTQLVQDVLDTIQTRNPSINAFTEVCTEQALEQAHRYDQLAADGQWQGPLHGVPVAIKDLIHVKGLGNTRGSHLYADHIADTTAPSAQRLIDAGAIIVGKTTTTEFGWKAASTCPLHGVTRNPSDLSRTSGGSSSGSAAALAAGMVAAALGSDGGGSVRIPASFCGIFSMKGTLGRVPAWPWSATEMLSHAGPMTLNTLDSALLFDVLKGMHWRDPQSLPDDGISYFERAQQPLSKSLRIAYAPTLFNVAVDPQVSQVVHQAIDTLGRGLKIDIAETAPGWDMPFEAFEALWCIGRGIVYGDRAADQLDQVDPGFARLIEWARKKQAKDFLSALEQRALFTQSVSHSFQDYDLLLMPAVPVLPFAAEDDGPSDWDPHSSPVAWANWTPFSYPFNLTGQPAASLPCGFTENGLPVGLQVVGARHDDATVLQFCAAAENVLNIAPPAWRHPD